jgi:prepilin-type N-terminal cleavage/methylation domain-containing protein/prepilin-type processing-associated H-X9-DG protein
MIAMKRRAFTLIELLVVIGIISILVAMLLPAVQRARAQAQSVACMSNLRQVYLGFSSYAHDFKEHFPFPLSYHDYLGDRLGRPERTSVPGGPHRRVLSCPSEKKLVNPNYLEPVTMYEHPYIRTSYMINWNIGGYAYTPGHAPGRTRKAFFDPTINVGGRSEAPFMADCSVLTTGWWGDYLHFEWNMNNPTWIAQYWNQFYSHAFRHPNLTANMLYMDGHVGSIRSVLHGGPNFYKTIFEGDVPP